MSILQAFSIVFERRPELRSTYLDSVVSFNRCLFIVDKRSIVRFPRHTGWKGFLTRYFSGSYVGWKVGLLLMPKPSHLNAGTRQVSLHCKP